MDLPHVQRHILVILKRTFGKQQHRGKLNGLRDETSSFRVCFIYTRNIRTRPKINSLIQNINRENVTNPSENMGFFFCNLEVVGLSNLRNFRNIFEFSTYNTKRFKKKRTQRNGARTKEEKHRKKNNETKINEMVYVEIVH